MIARLVGKLIKKQAPTVLLDVQGVGYELAAPMTTFYDLPEVGASVLLHTHMVVREDAQLLYGFLAEPDRELFRILIKINGVGAKLALALMSGMSLTEMKSAIHTDDTQAFVQVPGVGKKTAARLLVELRDKLDQHALVETQISQKPTTSEKRNDVNDAVSALISLGYKPPEASRMVRQVETEGMPSDEIIKHALKAAVSV